MVSEKSNRRGCRGGRGYKSSSPQNVRLVNVCQVQLGWAEQVAAATHREEGSFKLHLECSCSVDSSLSLPLLSPSLLTSSLPSSPPCLPLFYTPSALPAPPPDKAFSTLHCAAAGIRAEIRKTPLEILLPWTALPSTPLHSPPLPSSSLCSQWGAKIGA